MREDIKQRWVAALRSGKYCQTRGYLRSPFGEKYCCLGVLTDIAEKDGIQVEWDFAVTPGNVAEWAGLDSRDPLLELEDGTHISCSGVNDDLGLDFNRIADLIEENL